MVTTTTETVEVSSLAEATPEQTKLITELESFGVTFEGFFDLEKLGNRAIEITLPDKPVELFNWETKEPKEIAQKANSLLDYFDLVIIRNHKTSNPLNVEESLPQKIAEGFRSKHSKTDKRKSIQSQHPHVDDHAHPRILVLKYQSDGERETQTFWMTFENTLKYYRALKPLKYFKKQFDNAKHDFSGMIKSILQKGIKSSKDDVQNAQEINWLAKPEVESGTPGQNDLIKNLGAPLIWTKNTTVLANNHRMAHGAYVEDGKIISYSPNEDISRFSINDHPMFGQTFYGN